MVSLLAGGNAAETLPVHVRKYDLGLSYMQTSRAMPTGKAYDLIKDAADSAFIQGNWQDWVDGKFTKDAELARARKLKVFLGLDALGYVPQARASLEMPGGRKTDFTDAAAREAYVALIKKLAIENKPDYFNVLVEGSLHKKHSPKSYAAFKELFPKLCQDVKRVSPQTKMCVSVVFDADPKAAGIAAEVADFDATADVLAISTYPHAYLHPSYIPEDFLIKLAAHSKKPLFISETSWVNHTFMLPTPDGKGYEFTSSPEIQALYFARMATCAKAAQDKGVGIAAINFVTLCDPPAAVKNEILKLSKDLEWFCYLGVMDSEGKAKPAYELLKRWRAIRRE
jgi:hypothetical protein